MKIVILSGGSGSENIQRGLYEKFQGIEGVDIKILINAYDNGKSTGVVRQVADGNILGPSDMRKNQCIIHNVIHGNTSLYKFLDKRVSDSPAGVENFILENLKSLGITSLIPAVKTYFSKPTAKNVDYTDFSVANIIYAGLAMLNGNSLRKAGSIMADILGIPDNVILNDDTSLFLSAVSRSGQYIYDEGEIVSWNNPNDPIVDVYFKDPSGVAAHPRLSQEASDALSAADFIILSTGTLWASLVPTYESLDFRRIINYTKAKIFMISNLRPDFDAISTSGDEIAEILSTYFDNKKITLLHDKRGDPLLLPTKTEFYREVVEIDAKDEYRTTHEPIRLSDAIVSAFFKEYTDFSNTVVFDYDDTLVSRGNINTNTSESNLRSLNRVALKSDVYICTGNSIKNISPKISDQIYVYADGGINLYGKGVNKENPFYLVECIKNDLLLTQTEVESIYETLITIGIPLSKIENRGNAVIAIKPLDPSLRKAVSVAIRHELNFPIHVENPICVTCTGRSTIEISRKDLSKKFAVKQLAKKSIVYIGDEFNKSGNDRVVLGMDNVKCLKVNSTAMTNAFLKALEIKNVN